MYRRVKDFYLNQIERCIQFLKQLTPDQVEQLKSEKATIDFMFMGNKQDRPLIVTPDNKEQFNILMSVEMMESKKEVDDYFRSLGLKRKDLEALCKLKDIPFTKRDNMSMLKEKLYERLVGFKLRSRAIQNDKQ